MFTHIRTSKENKEVVTNLTNKLNLGAENIIARIAIAYSLNVHNELNPSDCGDSGGKEYAKSVLFGENESLYLGLISIKYNLSPKNRMIPKLLKLHLDLGLKTLNNKLKNNQTDNFDIIKDLLIF